MVIVTRPPPPPYEPLTVEDLDRFPRRITKALATAEVVEDTLYVHSRRAGGFTVRDLDALPDDGRRYELIDGVIAVSPSPIKLHQRAIVRLTVLLDAACPPELEVLVAPLDVDPLPRSRVQPDILARARDDLERPLPPPMLAVEVLSPSNRRHDLSVKRNLYERSRVPSYWVVDPKEPSLLVLELGSDDRYAEIARVGGGAEARVTRPFPVTIRPADLVR